MKRIAFNQRLRQASYMAAILTSAWSAGSAQAVNLIWDGGAASGDWGNGTNWQIAPGATDQLPVNGDSLFYTSTSNTQFGQTNTLAAGTQINGITFGVVPAGGTGGTSVGGFTIGGNSITLTGDLLNSSTNNTGTQILNFDIALSGATRNIFANATPALSNAGNTFDFTLGGAVSGNSNLVVNLDANGQTRFNGGTANTYTGNTTILAPSSAATASVFLGKTGGAVAIQGGTIVTMGSTGGTGQANLRMSANEQFGTSSGGVQMDFANPSGQWMRFDLLGTTQTLAGINTGNLTTQGSGVVQNGGVGIGAAAAATLTLNGSGNYVFNGHMRNFDNVNSGGVFNLIKNGSGTQTLIGSVITHTGTTVVNSGSLILQNTNAFNSATTVNSGATLTLANTFNTGTGAGFTIALNNGGTLVHNGQTNGNDFYTVAGAVTNSGTTTINQNSVTNLTGANKSLFLDGGLKGNGIVTINALNAGNGVIFRNNNTTFSGKLIVNGIASSVVNAGSGIGVGGNTSGLTNADIELNGTMELLNNGVGWAASASGDFFMGALSGNGVMVGNFTGTGGSTRVRIGNNNNSGLYSGIIVNGTGNVVSITKNGTGVQTFTGANTYTGTTTINAGELVLFNASTFNSATSIASGATMSWTGNNNMQNNNTGATIALNNGATLENLNPNHWLVINGAVNASGNSTINHESNATGVAGRGFYLDGGLKGTGIVTINALNAGSGVNFRDNDSTFSGKMIVNGIASATPFVGSGIGVGGNTTGLINADIELNGTMELLNHGIGWANGAPGDFHMGALSGSGIMVGNFTGSNGQTRVRVGNNNNSGVFSGSIVNGLNNIIVLTKNGTGVQTLSGVNTYTGSTTINAGTLALLGAGSIDNSPLINVVSGATFDVEGVSNFNLTSIQSLIGNGTINGDMITDAGSTISPGASVGAIGTLTFLDDLDINGRLLIDVNGLGGGTTDLINVAGLLDISGAILDFDLLNVIDDPFYIFASYGTLTGQFASIVGQTASGYVINYNFQGNNIALVMIPEPATMSLLALGSLALLRRRRKA